MFHGFHSSTYDQLNPLINDSLTVKKQFSKSSELIQKTGLVSNSLTWKTLQSRFFDRIFILKAHFVNYTTKVQKQNT